MDRILQGRSAVLTHTFYVNGTATNPSPDSATVTVVNSAGEALYEDAAATDTGAGTVSFTLEPDDTADLDTLTITWKATFDSELQSFIDTVEIAGGQLFTIADVRAMNDELANTSNYPNAEIARVRVAVEQALERHLGFALVPRFLKQMVPPGSTRVRLRPYVRALRAASSGGSSVATSDLSVDGAWCLTTSSTQWQLPAWVSYEHGQDGTDGEASMHALTLAKAWLIKGPIDDRTTVVASPDVGITQTLAIPGRGGSIFGIPSVDEYVITNRLVLSA